MRGIMKETTAAVQRMQDYIAEHLGEELTPAALARAAMFSPWYARRIFIEALGMSPADYIRRLRLSRSALRLRDDGCRVIDAALDAGFGSVDGYRRAFLREFGCNPKEYALRPVPIPLFIPYGAAYQRSTSEGRTEEMSAKTVFVREETRPARKIILKRGVNAKEYWSYCEEVGCDVWGILTSIRSLCGEPVCLWLPEALRPEGTSVYVQGVEVAPDWDGAVPEGFDVIDLPESLYLRFCGEPFDEADFETAIADVWDAEKKFRPETAGLAWDDTAPRIQLEPRGERGYMELMPVRRV